MNLEEKDANIKFEKPQFLARSHGLSSVQKNRRNFIIPRCTNYKIKLINAFKIKYIFTTLLLKQSEPFDKDKSQEKDHTLGILNNPIPLPKTEIGYHRTKEDLEIDCGHKRKIKNSPSKYLNNSATFQKLESHFSQKKS